MSKAIEGIAMLGGALLTGVAAFALASTGVGFAAIPFLLHASVALAVGGLGMEAGAAAAALSENRGAGITERQSAGYRQIVRGQRRIAGTEIFRSTTGSSKRQLNYVIVLSGQPVWAIPALYLDGRLVYFEQGSVGNSTHNGVNFGGSADGNSRTGPNGIQYNFGGLVYCEAKYGNQVSGDVIGGLTANDPTWAPTATGNPYVGGCTYVYLKIEGDSTVFPNEPEIKFTVMGKPVFDPRTGETTYTANWALHVADHIADPVFGIGDPYVNEDQLIAAANVCDAQIELAAGGTEAQWCLHWMYDTSMSSGNALVAMMEAADGRVRQIGGEWCIFPAYWQGPSFNFDHGALTDRMDWNPVAGIDKLCNTVTGTYIAPNYPYNVAGNLYDSNGFYEGQIQDNWNFGYQPTAFAQYARDVTHGYAANADLDQDSGVRGAWSASQVYSQGDVTTFDGAIWVSLQDANLNNPPAAATGSQVPSSMPWSLGALYLPMDLQLQTVCSHGQAQRLAKLKLMRSRFPGSGNLPMKLAAYAMQSLDVMQFTSAKAGWTNKVLEVDQPVLRAAATRMPNGKQGSPTLQVMVPVRETDPSIYEWSTGEEQTVYAAPATPVNLVVITGAQYFPSSYSDTGTQATTNAGDVYNGNTGTPAVVSAQATTPASGSGTQTEGTCGWAGFPSIAIGSDATLIVVASATITGSGTAVITCTFGSTTMTLATLTKTSASGTYTAEIPAGTALSMVSVIFVATAALPSSAGTATSTLDISEIYIQS